KFLNYRDLDELSDAMCRVLRARGAATGIAVGVRLPPTIDLVMVMLAIMKADAIYLPIDQSLPRERVRYMLEQAGAKLLVASSGNEFTAANCETVSLDTLQADISRLPTVTCEESRSVPRDADEAAY